MASSIFAPSSSQLNTLVSAIALTAIERSIGK
jgi:hypothetical protein